MVLVVTGLTTAAVPVLGAVGASAATSAAVSASGFVVLEGASVGATSGPSRHWEKAPSSGWEPSAVAVALASPLPRRPDLSAGLF